MHAWITGGGCTVLFGPYLVFSFSRICQLIMFIFLTKNVREFFAVRRKMSVISSIFFFIFGAVPSARNLELEPAFSLLWSNGAALCCPGSTAHPHRCTSAHRRAWRGRPLPPPTLSAGGPLPRSSTRRTASARAAAPAASPAPSAPGAPGSRRWPMPSPRPCRRPRQCFRVRDPQACDLCDPCDPCVTRATPV